MVKGLVSIVETHHVCCDVGANVSILYGLISALRAGNLAR